MATVVLKLGIVWGVSESTSPRVHLAASALADSVLLFLTLRSSPGVRPADVFPPAVATGVTLGVMFALK